PRGQSHDHAARRPGPRRGGARDRRDADGGVHPGAPGASRGRGVMRLGCAGQPSLTYCTNIHPGESWAEVFSALDAFVPAVKARVCPDAPFAVGLRLSARAATELLVPGELGRLRAFLAARSLYVPTING